MVPAPLIEPLTEIPQILCMLLLFPFAYCSLRLADLLPTNEYIGPRLMLPALPLADPRWIDAQLLSQLRLHQTSVLPGPPKPCGY